MKEIRTWNFSCPLSHRRPMTGSWSIKSTQGMKNENHKNQSSPLAPAVTEKARRKTVRTGIIGGAGYTGGELIRILLRHPQAEIAFVHSKSNTGKFLHEVHTDLIGETDIQFTDEFGSDADVWFLCLGHGEARQ